jgi:hypothetical protein
LSQLKFQIFPIYLVWSYFFFPAFS